MRVVVKYSIDISDDRRRAINAWYGRPGLATRQEVQAWYQSNGEAMDLDLDYSQQEEDNA